MTTYRRIKAVGLSNRILRFLADQRLPVTGKEVARGLDIKYETVMCHLATHEDDLMVRRIGEKFELGQGMAYYWARYKSQIESKIDNMTDELKQLEI
jgi:DNA-binding IclR family transcriptional regulator